MRKLVGDDWASHVPATNCLWLSYLAEVLAQATTVALTTGHKRALRDFRWAGRRTGLAALPVGMLAPTLYAVHNGHSAPTQR